MSLRSDWFKNKVMVTAIGAGLIMSAALYLSHKPAELQKELNHREEIKKCATYNGLHDIFSGAAFCPSGHENKTEGNCWSGRVAVDLLGPFIILPRARTAYERAYSRCEQAMP